MLEIFDLDHTLLNTNSSAAFFKYLIKQKILPKKTRIRAAFLALRYYRRKLSLKQLHKEVFERVLKGRKLSEIKTHVEIFLDSFLDKALSLELTSVLSRAQHLGHVTALISASPLFLVLPIGKRLGIDYIFASRYGTSQDGHMTHIEEIVDGRQKALYAKQLSRDLGIGKHAITAYSDSIEDWPLFLAVGNPIAVQPDKRLSVLAERRNLPVFPKI